MKPVLGALFLWSIFGTTVISTIRNFNTAGPSSVPIIDGPHYLKRHHAVTQHVVNQPVLGEHSALIYSMALIVIVALLIWMAIVNFRFNRYELPKLLHLWQNSFACRDCGTAFVAPDTETTVLTRG